MGFPGLAGELNHSGLFFFRQALYFFDDLNRSHAVRLPVIARARKVALKHFHYALQFRVRVVEMR